MARHRGITRRWMINGLGVIAGLLLVFEIAFMVAIQSYYYQSVENVLSVRAREAAASFERYISEATYDFENGAREYTENFIDKERMELQVINSAGRIVVSSTGFDPVREKSMPDYEQARTAEGNQGVWHGKNSAGENVMAMTVIMRRENTVLGAVRFVVSLSQVDTQIRILILVMVLIGVAIIFFVMLSSSYFNQHDRQSG